MKGYYAFWEYDLFPYLLSGRIVGKTGDGMFKIEGYGDYRFQPTYVLPPAKGAELAQELNTMKLEHDTQMGRVNRAFTGQREHILAVLKLYNKRLDK